MRQIPSWQLPGSWRPVVRLYSIAGLALLTAAALAGVLYYFGIQWSGLPVLFALVGVVAGRLLWSSSERRASQPGVATVNCSSATVVQPQSTSIYAVNLGYAVDLNYAVLVVSAIVITATAERVATRPSSFGYYELHG